MSFESDRNPSPPPEILDSNELLPDRVGDTVYSKQWIIKTLMDIVQFCDKEAEEINANGDNTDDFPQIIELDPEIEESACTLWDMSTSEPVSKFLFDSEVCDIFQDVIDKTNSPRLLEISVGILGNMCTFDGLCQSISENKDLVQMIIFLSGTFDTPSLLQVFRLVITTLRNETAGHIWLRAVINSIALMKNLKNILSNSLNCSLIITTFQLIYVVLCKESSYLELCGEEFLLESVITAVQLLFKCRECMDSFFCVFHTFCQYDEIVEKIALRWDEMKPLFSEYVDSLAKEECLCEAKRVTAVFCYFDCYNILLCSNLIEQASVLTGTDYLESVSLIFGTTINLITSLKKGTDDEGNATLTHYVKERNGTETVKMMSDLELNDWNSLLGVIIDTANSLKNYAEKESEKIIIEDILMKADIFMKNFNEEEFNEEEFNEEALII